jgi:NADH dehydrogenase (ubiquinone) 1 alpha subcomplex subunit 8
MAEAAGTPAPTSAVLMSLSKHIAVRCSKVNRAFVACKDKDSNPEMCLQAGEGVTGCVLEV